MHHRTAFYYDARSQLTCLLDPADGLTYYTYDAVGRRTSVLDPWGEVTYYDCTPGGRMRRRLGNGTLTYYGYDAAGQIAKVDNRKSTLADVIARFEYQRDLVGTR